MDKILMRIEAIVEVKIIYALNFLKINDSVRF